MRITRAVELIALENNSGNTTFITAYNTDFMVGDIVYISGGNYDTHSASCLASFNPFTTKGYRVLSKADSTNRITLNIPYTGTALASSGNCYISRNYFVTGLISGGNVYEGQYGASTYTAMKIGKLNLLTSSIYNLQFYNGVSVSSDFRIGLWRYNPTLLSNLGYRPNTIHMLSSSVDDTSVTDNNNGQGFSVFNYGYFGDSTNSTTTNTVWENGLWLGGTWANALWANGLMTSNNTLTYWTSGQFNGGTAQEILMSVAIWGGGSFVGSATYFTNLTYDNPSAPTYIKAQINPNNLYKFQNGQNVSIVGTYWPDLNNRVFVVNGNSTSGGNTYVNLYPIAGLSVLPLSPSLTLPLATITGNEMLGIGVFNAGSWNGGTFDNGIFGMVGSDSATWVAGTFSGAWLDGNWRNGTFTNDAFSYSRWYAGVWLKGNFINGVWTDGIWYTGTFTSSRFLSGIWVSGFFIGSTLEITSGVDTFWSSGFFQSSVANSNIRWNQVDYYSGTWQRNLATVGSASVTASGYGVYGEPIYTNNYSDYGLFFPPVSSPTDLSMIVSSSSGGSVSILAVSSYDGSGNMSLSAGQIIEVDVINYNGSANTNTTFYLRLTSANITAITQANSNVSPSGTTLGLATTNTTPYRFAIDHIPSLGYFSGITNPQARIVQYNNTPNITGYPTGINAEIRLVDTSGNQYGSTAGIAGGDNTGLFPLGGGGPGPIGGTVYTVKLYITATGSPTKWLTNAIKINNINIVMGFNVTPNSYNPANIQNIPGGGGVSVPWTGANSVVVFAGTPLPTTPLLLVGSTTPPAVVPPSPPYDVALIAQVNLNPISGTVVFLNQSFQFS